MSVQPVEEKAEKDFIYVYKYLIGRSKEDGAKHFSVMLSEST